MFKFASHMNILGLGILYFLILVTVPLSAQKIKIETKDGVTIVRNPKKPSKVPGAPKSLALIEDLCIGEPNSEEDYIFADIRSVQVDDEEDIPAGPLTASSLRFAATNKR